ncbi:hypothetical protein AHOG_07310 [Actinoalloteichus hoggarensis]|uniref:HTH luxR-type domain-containing protein n=1 Tax=Actinoalloteichus hoggarensis TaxID=1470176 RepID=A0A221W008_9PSEU|nr:hypothetical protein AHOG_07310 [Actinoalloteichus hoggarensis]
MVGEAGGGREAVASTRVLMSAFTVRAHVQRAMTRLEARDRAQLVVIAYQTGPVTGTESPAWTGSSLIVRLDGVGVSNRKAVPPWLRVSLR